MGVEFHCHYCRGPVEQDHVCPHSAFYENAIVLIVFVIMLACALWSIAV